MADPLSFGSSLDPQQQAIAKKIIERAIEMGVDPRLAVSVAYQESRLRADVENSPKGAVGIMQVMPATGKEFGFSKQDLMNPDRNIEAGLTVLKAYMDKFPDDPRLGVVAYNAGPNHPFFTGGNLPQETLDYVRSIKNYGAFQVDEPAGEPTITEEDVDTEFPEAPVAIEQAPLPTAIAPQNEQSIKDVINRLSEADPADLAAGAGAYGGYKIGQMLDRAPPVQVTAPGMPSSGQPAGMPSGQAPEPAMPRAGALPAGAVPTGGKMAFNWGKAGGLGDIEAGRATAMGNAPGSADELIKARAAALERLQGISSATGMAEDPTRGGMMVPQQTPYTGPRGPGGEIGGAKPPPVSPVTPKPAGALEDITAVLRNMMSIPLIRRAVPIAGGALAGGEFARMGQELSKRQPDYTTVGLSGLSGLGGVMSLFPPAAPVGVPLSLGAGALQFGRERARENEALGYRPDVIPSNPMGDFGF
jgi:hypothetical protein